MLGRGTTDDVRLPAYAPELNPVEGVWAYLKRVELLNTCCHSLYELRVELRLAIARVRHRSNVLAGCLRQPGWYTLPYEDAAATTCAPNQQ